MNQTANYETNELTSDARSNSESSSENRSGNQRTVFEHSLMHLGIASHMVVASNKIESELSVDKRGLWQPVLRKAIRPGVTLNYSWWLFSQWLLCKIGDVFVEDSSEDYLCTEVCTLYEFGCDNLEVWQGLIVKIALCQNPSRSQAQENAIAALAQIAQTAIHLISTATTESYIERRQPDKRFLDDARILQEVDFMGRTLDLACFALLSAPTENLSREEVYEQFGSQFLHTISLA